ncbi:RNB domain-containing ribonuclease [Desulfovibrio piger]
MHPQPDPERLESLFDSLEAIDPELVPVKPAASALQGILRDVQGSDREFLVGRLCLRAMPQARYQPENEGHFGLASRAYCHFTSPIRRYADLLVHRALKASLGLYDGALPAGQKLLRVADQLNRREREALDCEREMARRLACMALEGRVGERFRGVVAGVNEFGLFVELSEMPVEGMIRVEDAGDDWYDFDARRQCLVGQRSGLCWSMGQSLEVVLAEVHSGRLEIRLLPRSWAWRPAAADVCRAGGRDDRARLRPVMPNCRISARAVTATGSVPCAAKDRPAGMAGTGLAVPQDGGDADELFLAKTAHGRGGPDPGRQHHPVPPHGTGARQGHFLAVRRGQ